MLVKGNYVLVIEDNITDIAENPDNYKDYLVIIDGRKITDGRKLFTIAVEDILECYKRLPFRILILSPEMTSPRIRENLKHYETITQSFITLVS